MLAWAAGCFGHKELFYLSLVFLFYIVIFTVSVSKANYDKWNLPLGYVIAEAVTASVSYWLTAVQPGRPLCITDTNLTCSAVPLDDFKFTFQYEGNFKKTSNQFVGNEVRIQKIWKSASLYY